MNTPSPAEATTAQTSAAMEVLRNRCTEGFTVGDVREAVTAALKVGGDRPGQADAAVAEAERYEWRRKVDFDGPGPWYPCDRSWIDHLVGDDLYETRSLYVTSEAVLLAAKPRSEWRPIETAPSGKWVLLNYGEVFASHTGYRQNDGKWVHPENREPVAWMLLPSTKLCPPPVSVPASKCDRPGQADAAVTEARYLSPQARALLGCKAQFNAPTDSSDPRHQTHRRVGWFVPHEIAGLTESRALLKEIAEAALRATAPREKSDGWRAVLQAHHDWHLAQGEVACGEGIIDMADAYTESDLCNRTVDVLRNAPPTAAPFPPVDHAGGQGESTTLPPEALEAWTNYEPPVLKTPFSALKDAVLIRHAFMSGFLARTPTPTAPAPGREDGDAEQVEARHTLDGRAVEVRRARSSANWSGTITGEQEPRVWFPDNVLVGGSVVECSAMDLKPRRQDGEEL